MALRERRETGELMESPVTVVLQDKLDLLEDQAHRDPKDREELL